MDVYLLDSDSARILGHPRWQPPMPLYVDASARRPSRFLTGGGLIRHGTAVYILTTEDLSALKWSYCHDSPRSRGSSHSQCQKVTRTVKHYSNSQPPPALGRIGTLVHASSSHGYSLVRVDLDFFAGEEELIAQWAVPLESLGSIVDGPRVMDFVEFTSSQQQQEVTGVVMSSHTYCTPKTNGGEPRRKIECLLVDTASYAVTPEDCGLWVQRSVASDRPMLLGHILGFSEEGSFGMLMLPFSSFQEDLVRTIRGKRFNIT